MKYHLGAEGIARHARRRDHGHARRQPEPPRGRRPGRRGPRARRADRPLDARRLPRPDASRSPSSSTATRRSPARAIVAETLNLEGLVGYSTGGTLHLIANNQVGFTTDPSDGRSTRYSSDLAKGFDIPIIHVNADDPEAAIAGDPARARLPAAVRPRRRRRPRRLPAPRTQRAGRGRVHAAAARRARSPSTRPCASSTPRSSSRTGVVTARAGGAARSATCTTQLRAAHEALKQTLRRAPPQPTRARSRRRRATRSSPQSRADRLRALNEELLRVPDGFTPHPKLLKQLERRRDTLDEGGIDWGQAEALAFASLLVDGHPDPPHRPGHGARHVLAPPRRPPRRLTPAGRSRRSSISTTRRAAFEIYNSPLSEYACVGFEYGYSAAAPEALVLWEAQFGDFVNGAQIVIDQFISAGLSKWGESTRLTLLLPHGYEGNGPEHSSARLERFLQLAAQENIRIANCTTSAQYFHLLRRQALDATARPLVVMTPKGLLRLKQASSTLDDLAHGEFQPVLDDARADHEQVTRLVLCQGKVYYDIVGHEERAARRRGRGRAARAALPVPGRGARRRSCAATRTSARSCGRRRSRRTWARGARFATGSRRRRPTCRCPTSAARGGRARARGTRPRTCASRTGSSGRSR